MLTTQETLRIAKACHLTNAIYCQAIGDPWCAWRDEPSKTWESILAGVEMHLEHPEMTSEASHEAWLARKVSEGWVWGRIKDAASKQHPCCVPYGALPTGQREKDDLFRSTVALVKTPESAEQTMARAQKLLTIAGKRILMVSTTEERAKRVLAYASPEDFPWGEAKAYVQFAGEGRVFAGQRFDAVFVFGLTSSGMVWLHEEVIPRMCNNAAPVFYFTESVD